MRSLGRRSIGCDGTLVNKVWYSPSSIVTFSVDSTKSTQTFSALPGMNRAGAVRMYPL